MSQLVIFTDSHDTTADLIVQHLSLEQGQLFRLNYDFFADYKFAISPSAFAIEDPLGRVASSTSVTKFLYRKPNRPRQFSSELDRYVEAEQWAAMRALISSLWRTERVVLVEPYDASLRLDKLAQLEIASQFFAIPNTSFTCNRAPGLDAATVLTKSLSGMWMGQRLLYATRVAVASLDVSYPWFSQDCIDAKHDVTVVYIRGRLFAYRLDRTKFLTRRIVDWKEEMGEHGLSGWEWLELGPQQSARITSLMNQFRLDYGRLDFLIGDDGDLVFLEVNPNGQFAWLDINDSRGMLTSYCEAVNPNTDRYPISWSPYLCS